MLDPFLSTDKENNYMLATIIGKRAVQLTKGSEMLTKCNASNRVTIAICEYKENKLAYTSNESPAIKTKHKNKEYRGE